MNKKILMTLGLAVTFAAVSIGGQEANANENTPNYEVKSGDTLWGIANSHGLDLQEFRAANNKLNSTLIIPGEKLVLSTQAISTEYVEQSYVPEVVNYEAPVEVYNNYEGSQGGSVVLSNGNTAGAVGLSAAQELARRTGQPVSVWEEIIAKESNGDVNAYNPSGASGLFQTMPGWGDTSTVEGQINAAERAYNEQGLGAWYGSW